MKKNSFLLFCLLWVLCSLGISYAEETANNTIDDSLIVVYNAPLQALVAMITEKIYTPEVLFDPNTTHYFEILTNAAKAKLNKAKYVVILDRDYNKNITQYLEKNNPTARLIVSSDIKQLRLINPASLFLNSNDPLIKAKVDKFSTKNKKKTEAELLLEGEKLLDKNSVSYVAPPEEDPQLSKYRDKKETIMPKEDFQLQDYNFYLDPKKSIIFLKQLNSILEELEPNNADMFHKNFNKYRKVLKNLNDDIKTQIEQNNKGQSRFYSNTWQYFQEAYSINKHPVILTETLGSRKYHQLTPDEITVLNTYVNQHHITCIFTEKQFDDLLLQKYIKQKQLKTATLSSTGYNIPNRSPISNYLYMLKRNAEIFTYCSN